MVSYKLKDHTSKVIKIRTGEAVIKVANKDEYDQILASKFEIHGRALEVSKASKKWTFDTAAALYKDLIKEI